MVNIRPMRHEDVAPVALLEQQLFAGDPPWSAEQFHDELDGVPQSRWYVVAESETTIVGYGGLHFLGGEDQADIQTIAVASQQQRSGVGSELLSALITQAAARGVREILLEVRADNATAQGLYRKFDFTPISTRRRYYADGCDGLVMRKELESQSSTL